MTMTVQAVFTGGVLRPLEPLTLAEGEVVEVTILPAKPAGPHLRPPTAEEEDYARRLKAARSLDEMLAAVATAPPLPDGYDLCQALNANRRVTGERLLYPECSEGSDT
jgi:predicted DNA-binding antitoxin AbrB/MazE fold protein